MNNPIYLLKFAAMVISIVITVDIIGRCIDRRIRGSKARPRWQNIIITELPSSGIYNGLFTVGGEYEVLECELVTNKSVECLAIDDKGDKNWVYSKYFKWKE